MQPQHYGKGAPGYVNGRGGYPNGGYAGYGGYGNPGYGYGHPGYPGTGYGYNRKLSISPTR